jgi:hypothetical protein
MDRSWQSEWTSRSLGLPPSSSKENVASGEIVPAATVSLIIANSKAGVSGWDLQSFNKSDPVEVAQAAGLRESAAAHVPLWLLTEVRDPFFVNKCASMAAPRFLLPADEITVALYL